ncbi:unnamed protein product [Rotaria magnacalcarata]|uniref:Uncharacterized protein n=1 Tax=Rotaria magnacalcarata TaxID=392030 RepID=A0A814EW07_9BILA|nr:unnamed protein product [Rotaria magnacalcarata]CAF1251869.1 unnamed protein product [Rotaria magnacalcarata]CAF1904942.1 unnamed protein product [Rotaria magnacalcarata]CAF1931543.1 unnamed protein product [Rotaria magnacalcarata]CAF2100130.1 unnamed protein product [Rotaria magnacalcarata]
MEKVEDDININECNMHELLPALFRLQSQRSLTYQRLYDAQAMFLNTHNFPGFQVFLSDITIIFARISEEILLIKKRFENNKNILKHIEQLQDYEEKKLQLTNDMFVAKIEKKNEQFQDINEKSIKLIDDINEILDELRYDQQDLNSMET